MKTRIVKIGNSQGIRIPKVLLEHSRIGNSEVELEVEDNRIVIRPLSRPRDGWDEAFRSMAEHGDDRLLDKGATSQTHWDEAEWEW
jgi:antitoxin MazE